MGKKRNVEPSKRDDDPPEKAEPNEGKKTRMANYTKLSTETLHAKEREMMQELCALQADLSRMRSSNKVLYGNDELRQMNTKRYRAEYALGEIKAEIERRARKRAGEPHQVIHSGSTAGVAAVSSTNQLQQAVQPKETSKMLSGVLQENVQQPDPPAKQAKVGPQNTAPMPPPAVTPPAMQMPLPFNPAGVLEVGAMMGAMGSMPAQPTAEEMAMASQQFQQMQQFQQYQQFQQFQPAPQQMQMPQFHPVPQPIITDPTPAISSNVPAAFLKRAQQRAPA